MSLNNVLMIKEIQKLRLENRKLREQIDDANIILDLAEFENLTGAHKIHWSNWQSLRLILKSSVANEKSIR